MHLIDLLLKCGALAKALFPSAFGKRRTIPLPSVHAGVSAHAGTRAHTHIRAAWSMQPSPSQPCILTQAAAQSSPSAIRASHAPQQPAAKPAPTWPGSWSPGPSPEAGTTHKQEVQCHATHRTVAVGTQETNLTAHGKAYPTAAPPPSRSSSLARCLHPNLTSPTPPGLPPVHANPARYAHRRGPALTRACCPCCAGNPSLMWGRRRRRRVWWALPAEEAGRGRAQPARTCAG